MIARFFGISDHDNTHENRMFQGTDIRKIWDTMILARVGGLEPGSNFFK